MNNRKTSGLLIVFLFLLSFTSCYFEPTIFPLDDLRFNGEFNYYLHHEKGEHSYTIDNTFIFNGTNKVIQIYKGSKYTTEDGWTYFGDYPGDSVSYTMEAAIIGETLKLKVWGCGVTRWAEEYIYSFNDDGTTLTLVNSQYSSLIYDYNKIE